MSLRLALTAVVLLATAAPAGAVDLLSHRAAYRLSLASSGSTGTMSDVRGALVLETKESCDGWISNQRLGFRATTGEGQGFTYDVRFSSWESTSKRKLRFNVRSFDDGKLFEEFRGEAAVADSGKGSAEFVVPPGRSVDLPNGTLFPTEHIRHLIEQATKGERFVSASVFDGSGDNALSTVSAVIGQQAKPVDLDGGQPAWPMSLAYHSLTEPSELPEFEISFTMRADGVVRDLVLDYGDFALKGELEKLEPLEKPDCG